MNVARSLAGRGAARQEGRRRVRLQREGRAGRGDGEVGGGREERTRLRRRRPRYVRSPARARSWSQPPPRLLTGPSGFWQLFQAGFKVFKAASA